MKNPNHEGRQARVPVVHAVRETRYSRHGLPNQLVTEQVLGVPDVRID